MTPIIVTPSSAGTSTLSVAQLAAMRRDANRMLPDTAVLYSNTLTSDDGGGYTEAFSAAGTVACRVAPITSRSGGEGEVGDRIEADAQYVITLPAETSIETDDRIMVGQITYNVVAVRDRSWEITRRVEAKKVV